MGNRFLKKLILAGITLAVLCSFMPHRTFAEDKLDALYVNGIDVLQHGNQADILGDGTVSFDAEAGVLTLSSAILTEGTSHEPFAENPHLFFYGDLTLCLRGDSRISCGTSTVMGQPLLDNAIYGSGTLTVTGEEGASLTVDGMIQLQSYVQKSGTVTITLSNDHSRITKWGMYLSSSLTMEGGTLAVSTVGKHRDGAVMLEEKAIVIADGAQLFEGELEPDEAVSALSLKDGLTYTTRDCIRIVLLDCP